MTSRQTYAFLAVAVLGGAATAITLGTLLGEFVYYGTYAPICALGWWAAVRRSGGPTRLPWVLIALVETLWLSGDLIGTFETYVLHSESEVSLSNAPWLAAYPVLGMALVVMVRRRAPGQLRAGVLDGLTLTTAAGIAAWQLLVAPMLAGTPLTLPVLVGALYPFADVVLLAGVVLLVFAPGARGVPTKLLIGSIFLILLVDLGYHLLPALIGDDHAQRMAGVVLVGNAMLVATGLHPDRAELITAAWQRRTLHPGRVLLLAVALLTAPAMALVGPDPGAGERILLLVAIVVASVFILVRFTTAVREQERAQRELAHHAEHDPLTGLANRRILTDRLTAALTAADGNAILLYVDLDGFKAVNDTGGHEAGDAVLVEVAHRLAAAIRSTDVLARLGGDEFAVLCPGAVPVETAVALAERVLADVREPVLFNGQVHRVGASIGIAMATPDGVSRVTGVLPAHCLLRSADAAMYQAKRLGRGRWVMADAVLEAA